MYSNCLAKPHKDLSSQHLHFLLGNNTISLDGMHWETANKCKLKKYAASSKSAEIISLTHDPIRSKESHMNTNVMTFGLQIR